MLTAVILSTFLIMSRLGGKPIHSDKTLSTNDGRHSVRKQPHQQIKQELRRSLDLQRFKVHMTPTTGKITFPNILKLDPPISNPLHLHTNLPLRFGRNSNDNEVRTANSTPNMPQRFGRSWGVTQPCTYCSNIQDAPKKPQRPGRSSLFQSLLRSLRRNSY
ncbi:pro-FMRFamide-related neuropeptide VF [Antennarius striatus]|uniref:pro-FMRFamide-related neuropeptide VF n=1 Tax=Antennarius striatus TaxID=241820 RepID=UPI0035ADEFA0